MSMTRTTLTIDPKISLLLPSFLHPLPASLHLLSLFSSFHPIFPAPIFFFPAPSLPLSFSAFLLQRIEDTGETKPASIPAEPAGRGEGGKGRSKRGKEEKNEGKE